jgi:hypothetical protein
MRRPLMKIVGVLETWSARPFAWLASTAAAASGLATQVLKVLGFRPICET